jgi:hypothetical protein
MIAMTVAELKTWLANVPDDFRIFYRHGNYGGPRDEFYDGCIQVDSEKKIVLFDSPYWEAVE